MTNEYNNAYSATYTQFCSTFGSKNKESSNSKLHGGGGLWRQLRGIKKKKKENQILSFLLILVIFSPPKTTVGINTVEPRDAREFSRSDPAGPDLDYQGCVNNELHRWLSVASRDATERVCVKRRGEKETEADWRPRTPRGSSLQANALVGRRRGKKKKELLRHSHTCTRVHRRLQGQLLMMFFFSKDEG